MGFMYMLVPSAVLYQLWAMTTLSSYGWIPKFLVLPWLSGKSLHISIQSSTESKGVNCQRATTTPRSFPCCLTESPPKHGGTWTAHRLQGKARPRPWFVQKMAWRKIPVVWISPWLKTWPSEMSVTTLSRKLGFSSCNFQMTSSQTLLAVLLLNWCMGNSHCYCYIR